MTAGGPWAFEDVGHLIDFDGDAPWHGGDRPEPLAEALNPGGLVAVARDTDGGELGRWMLTTDDPLAGIDQAIRLIASTGRLILFDGDSGAPVASLQPGP